jgi:hypothetical protein
VYAHALDACAGWNAAEAAHHAIAVESFANSPWHVDCRFSAERMPED